MFANASCTCYNIMVQRDGFLVVLILVVAALIFVGSALLPNPGGDAFLRSEALYGAAGSSHPSARVVVYVDNQEYAVYPLDKENTVTIDRGDGRVCVIQIEPPDAHGGSASHEHADNMGCVFMHASTCPNQICVNTGKLTIQRAKSSDLRSWIVCAPNGVSIWLDCSAEDE